MNSKDYIYKLIEEGEHQQQDFKFEISDARKIAKSLSAFSNTDGGRLLIGVKDNGKIAGGAFGGGNLHDRGSSKIVLANLR